MSSQLRTSSLGNKKFLVEGNVDGDHYRIIGKAVRLMLKEGLPITAECLVTKLHLMSLVVSLDAERENYISAIVSISEFQ